METLCEQGAALAVSTHYEPLKAFSIEDRRLRTASVGFDVARMEPSFKLALDVTGASSALAALSAMAHIQAGIYDCIAVVGVELMKSASPAQGGDYLGTAAWYERESAGVEFPFPKLFGRLGDHD